MKNIIKKYLYEFLSYLGIFNLGAFCYQCNQSEITLDILEWILLIFFTIFFYALSKIEK
jgi:hypothetical protein